MFKTLKTLVLISLYIEETRMHIPLKPKLMRYHTKEKHLSNHKPLRTPTSQKKIIHSLTQQQQIAAI